MSRWSARIRRRRVTPQSWWLANRFRHCNVTLFIFGLGIIFAAAGFGASGLVLDRFWKQAVGYILGLSVIALSLLHQGEAAPEANQSARQSSGLAGVPGVPPRFVPRPEILNDVVDHLLPVRRQAGPRRVTLHGMGGAGKTVLATAIAHDPRIAAAFPDGVLWVETGPAPSLLPLQKKWASKISSQPFTATTVDEGTAFLCELLAGRRLLLVVDNAWHREDLAAFDAADAGGALLCTSRDPLVGHALGAWPREVAELGWDQALDLFADWAELDRADLPAITDAILGGVDRLALGVAMTGGMVAERRRLGTTPSSACNEVLALINAADPAQITQAIPGYPHPNIGAAIQVSIDDLNETDRSAYRQLAVFTGRGPVPRAAIDTLWASQSAPQVTDLLVRLSRRALIFADAHGSLTLHDLQYELLTHQLAGGVARVHRLLLDHYRRRCPNGRWPFGPDDGYFLQNLCHHLAAADRRTALQNLLVDYDWLDRKLASVGITGLLADYSCAQPHRPDVAAVHGALQLSSPTLAADPGMLAGQLVGCLLNLPESTIQRLLDRARAAPGAPWLCPQTQALTPPGGPLERVLLGHTGAVFAVAVTPDGSRAVSVGYDSTLRVWNLTSGRCERTLESHTGAVTAVAVTPDGSRAVSAGNGYTLRVWHLTSGRCEHTLKGHTGARDGGVRAVAVTPDGSRAVSASDDHTLRVWNLTSGRCEHTLKGHTGALGGGVRAVAVTPDGSRAVSASSDSTLRVWHLASGRCEHTLKGHTGGVGAVAVTADGSRAVSASSDSTLRVWHLASGRCEHTLKGHTGGVGAVAVTADGSRAVSASSDSTLRVWHLASGRCEHTLKGHTGAVGAVAVTADGSRAVSASSDSTLRVWHLASGRCEHTLKGHTGAVGAVAVTADGSRAVSASSDSTLRVWHLASGRCEHTLKGHTGAVFAVAVTPDGSRAVSAGKDHTLRVWNLASGRCEDTLESHTGAVTAVAVTPDGSRAVSASDDHTLRVWHLASGRCEHTLAGHTGAVTAVAVTADGSRAVSASSDSTLRVWHLASGRCEHTLEGHSDALDAGWVFAVAVTADGSRAVSAGYDSTLRVWNLASGRCEHTLAGHTGEVSAVAVTPDGSRAVSAGSDFTLRVWNLASGWCEHTLEVSAPAAAMAVTPDGSRVVSADYDSTLRVWNLASGRCEHTLKGHTGAVGAVAVTPDGSRAVSASDDHTLRVWNLASGRCEHTLKGHTGAVRAVAVTPDGSRAVSASDDHTLRVWNLHEGHEVARWTCEPGTGVAVCCSVPTDPTLFVYGNTNGRVDILCLHEPFRTTTGPQPSS